MQLIKKNLHNNVSVAVPVMDALKEESKTKEDKKQKKELQENLPQDFKRWMLPHEDERDWLMGSRNSSMSFVKKNIKKWSYSFWRQGESISEFCLSPLGYLRAENEPLSQASYAANKQKQNKEGGEGGERET